MAAHIFLTQTYLDIAKISQAIAFQFKLTGKVVNIDLKSLENPQKLIQNWDHLQGSKRLIVESFETKSDFRDSLMKLYEVYPQPTLLFLGDLSNYSIQLQEGMLRLLEEPPHNLEIILFAQNRSQILPTITSRVNLMAIPGQVVMSALDPSLLGSVKTKLPQPIDFCKELIQLKNGQKIELPDLSKVEREELDFWLWQLQIYFSRFYEQKPQKLYADYITRILNARKLNGQNLQKKFALSQILMRIES